MTQPFQLDQLTSYEQALRRYNMTPVHIKVAVNNIYNSNNNANNNDGTTTTTTANNNNDNNNNNNNNNNNKF